MIAKALLDTMGNRLADKKVKTLGYTLAKVELGALGKNLPKVDFKALIHTLASRLTDVQAAKRRFWTEWLTG